LSNFNKWVFFLVLEMSCSVFTEQQFLDSTYACANDSNCLIAISAYYNKSRLPYLFKVVASLGAFPEAKIIVLTNTFDKKELANLDCICLDALSECKGNVSFSIRSYPVDPALGGKGGDISPGVIKISLKMNLHPIQIILISLT